MPLLYCWFTGGSGVLVLLECSAGKITHLASEKSSGKSRKDGRSYTIFPVKRAENT
jgi:hypothetical protein